MKIFTKAFFNQLRKHLESFCTLVWGFIAGACFIKYGLDYHSILTIIAGVAHETRIFYTYIDPIDKPKEEVDEEQRNKESSNA